MSREQFLKFNLPVDLENFPKDIPDRVCVVVVIGKGRHDYHKSKAWMLNNFIRKDVFLGTPSIKDNASENAVQIEGHYDEDRKVIFLHLWSSFDTNAMTEMCQKANEDISQIGYHNFLMSAEYQHAKAMLFLFSVCHIILLVHPGNSFDVTYVRLFRVLDSIRTKIQPSVTEALRGMGLPKDWVVSARPCSPRVLFLFERSALGASDSGDTMVMSKTRSQKTPPIKRLQHAIEDQIYRILRKSRIITNISNNSLFAVPANQEFVHIFQQKDPSLDPISYYLTELHNNSVPVLASQGARSHSYQAARRRPQSASHGNMETIPARLESSSSNRNSFKDFLWQHIHLAQSKGFDDNVGRNPVPAVFELPQLHHWLEVTNKLYMFFLLDQPESRAKPHFNTLKSLLEIDNRFSELRCSKILPLAERAYREGLPVHYTRHYHQEKLEQAKQVFLQHARGPASDKYKRQLMESCDKFWQSGRQQCEERSLTDQLCMHPLHRVPEIPETEANSGLQVLAHTSQIKVKAACNCGHKQTERDDPFDHRTANYDFYQRLEQHCCGVYESFALPIFQSTTTDATAGMSEDKEIKESDAEAVSTKLKEGPPMSNTPPGPLRKDSALKLDLATGQASLSLALSLGQSGASDMFTNNNNASFNAEGSHDLVSMVTDGDTDNTVPSDTTLRQASTTEYLPGMLHSESPTGLLPKFPSWSLICLGNYSSYNPSLGLDQPGFMHGSNFLLPWDVVIKNADRDKWPAVGETPKKGKGIARRSHKDSGEFVLRVYIGLEYECPRGHRFTLSGPDKIFKAPGSGIFKETAGKVINNDMPLYFPCHCRNPKGFMGQLMRVFVVVPEGPLEVKLNVRVRPRPGPCPVFYPSSEGAIPLTAGVWVMRLPYVYLGEMGVYMMPTDSQALAGCRICKGIISAQEVK